MNNLCCISLTISARFIGIFGLATSILVINVVVGEFFEAEEDSSSSGAAWIFLGQNWAGILRQSQNQKRFNNILICFLVYSMMYLLSSAFLVLGTLTKRRKYTMPWLLLGIVSMTIQAVAMAMHLTHGKHHNDAVNPTWYLPLSSLYLLMTVYFWLVVFAAQKSWLRSPSIETIGTYVASSIPESGDMNMKTPSVLSHNYSIFESPQPYIPSRYHQV